MEKCKCIKCGCECHCTTECPTCPNDVCTGCSCKHCD